MCWPHVHRNLESHFKHLRSVNKEIASKLKKDIEVLQWAAFFIWRKFWNKSIKIALLTQTRKLLFRSSFNIWRSPKNSCRVNSPPPPPVIPMASYHPASPELQTLSPVGPGSAFSGVRSQPTPSTPVLASRRPADQSSPELMSSEVTSPCPGSSLAATTACSPHSAAEPSPSITLPPATRKSKKTKVSNPPINRKR